VGQVRTSSETSRLPERPRVFSSLPVLLLASLYTAMKFSLLLLLALVVLVSLTTVSGRRTPGHKPKHSPTPPPRDWSAATADPVGPNFYCITWETNVNTTSPAVITIEVNRTLAPLGSDRLYALLQDNFFDFQGQPAAFFRVVPQFVVQFGISGVPAENTKWNVVIPVSTVHESERTSGDARLRNRRRNRDENQADARC
jgi:hypothetical protein